MLSLSKMEQPWLIVSLQEEQPEVLSERILREIRSGTKTIEIRGDGLRTYAGPSFPATQLMDALDYDIGVLFTCMSPKEKPSKHTGTEDERIKHLKFFGEARASITVEHRYTSEEFKRECKKNGFEVVGAIHYWEGTPPLEEIQHEIDEMGYASILKVFAKGNSKEDVTKWEGIASYLQQTGKPFITALMGEEFRDTRIRGIKDYRASGTFCRSDYAEGTAPGQYKRGEMEKELGFT